MKLRIVVSTLLVLLISVLASSFVLYQFFHAERLRLIDQQLETMASTILAEGIERTRAEELAGLIAHALGDEPTEYVIGYWDQLGELLYSNPNYSRVLESGKDIPRSPERVMARLGKNYVRTLNLRDLQNHVLQVGLVLGKDDLRWNGLSKSAWPYLSLIIGILLVATFLLTSFFLRPLLKVGTYLEHFSENLLYGGNKPDLPKELLPFLKTPLRHDEFSKLIETLGSVSERLSLVFRLNQSAATQMAHELKTPLTVIRTSLEMPLIHSKGTEVTLSSSELKEVIREVDDLSQTINDFLNWSRAAYLRPSETATLKYHSLKTVVSEIVEQWAVHSRGRIVMEASSDPKILADSEHLRQVTKNLLQNALSYSDPETPVKVFLIDRSLVVENQGGAIPMEVLSRLGNPFNRGGEGRRGTGLGLAWIHTLCRIYGWKLSFDYQKPLQRAKIEFIELAVKI